MVFDPNLHGEIRIAREKDGLFATSCIDYKIFFPSVFTSWYFRVADVIESFIVLAIKLFYKNHPERPIRNIQSLFRFFFFSYFNVDFSPPSSSWLYWLSWVLFIPEIRRGEFKRFLPGTGFGEFACFPSNYFSTLKTDFCNRFTNYQFLITVAFSATV